MASKTLTPLIRQVTQLRQSRNYAQAAPAFKNLMKASCCVNPKKTIVAAVEDGSPLVRVTVAFKAGARFEPTTELGITHVLRSAAGLTTSSSSAFMLTRKLAQIGASVSASGDREFVYYTLEGTLEQMHPAMKLMANMINDQEFRPWELDDNKPRLQFDIAALSPQVRAVDLLHRAAYRRDLGNSLFISPKRIGKICSEALKHYVCTTMTLDRCAVVVVGADRGVAEKFAQTLKLNAKSQAVEEQSVYYGGDARKEIGGDLAHIAIAGKGAPAGSKDALALAVYSKALGCGPSVKWGSDNGMLAHAIGNIGPFAAAGFNVAYSDSGLMGAVLTVPYQEANKAVAAVVSLLKSAKIEEKDLIAGKSQLKLQIMSEADCGTSLGESLAAQALYTCDVKTPTEIGKCIDSITVSDVQKAVCAAFAGKFSMAAVGNLASVPYADEINN